LATQKTQKKPAERTKEREAHGSNSWETKQNQQKKEKKKETKKKKTPIKYTTKTT
jgi:hypothetical protein